MVLHIPTFSIGPVIRDLLDHTDLVLQNELGVSLAVSERCLHGLHATNFGVGDVSYLCQHTMLLVLGDRFKLLDFVHVELNGGATGLIEFAVVIPSPKHFGLEVHSCDVGVIDIG